MRWTLIAFCGWLTLLPIPLGSNRTWALALSLAPLLLLAAIVAWRREVRAQTSLPAPAVRWPGVCLALFLGVVLVQLVPIGASPISIVPHRTRIYALVALGCAVSFWLVIALVRDERALRTLLYTLVACGALQALIGMALTSGQITIPVLDSELAPDEFSGTFTNRNHLAAYLNMCLAAGIGLLMGKLAAPQADRNLRQRMRAWIELMLSDKARLRLVLVLMVIALILTRSRMGNAAFFFGLIVAASAYAVYAQSRRRGLMLFVASLVVVDVALIGAWVGLDRVVERVQMTSLEVAESATHGMRARAPKDSIGERIEPALDAVRIVRAHPLLGTGGGTFSIAFMEVASFDMGFIMHVHNDWLEIATDTGLTGLAALLALGLGALVMSIRILRERRNPYARAAAFCTLMALACIGMHGIVHFGLQIPAIAMTMSAIAALPFAAQSFSARERPQTAPRRSTRAGVAIPIMATVVACAGAYAVARLGLADVLSIRGSAELIAWEADGTPLAADTAMRGRSNLTQAIAIAPGNPETHEALGTLEFATASSARERPAAALKHFRDATTHARTSPYAWGNLLLTKHRSGEIDTEFDRAMRNAARYGPYEPNVQAMIIEAGLANWARLDTAQREIVSATVSRAWETNTGSVIREALNAPGRELWCGGGEEGLRPLCERLQVVREGRGVAVGVRGVD